MYRFAHKPIERGSRFGTLSEIVGNADTDIVCDDNNGTQNNKHGRTQTDTHTHTHTHTHQWTNTPSMHTVAKRAHATHKFFRTSQPCFETSPAPNNSDFEVVPRPQAAEVYELRGPRRLRWILMVSGRHPLPKITNHVHA